MIGTNAAAVKNFFANSDGVKDSYGSLSTATRSLRGRASKGVRVSSAAFYGEADKEADKDLLSDPTS